MILTLEVETIASNLENGAARAACITLCDGGGAGGHPGADRRPPNERHGYDGPKDNNERVENRIKIRATMDIWCKKTRQYQLMQAHFLDDGEFHLEHKALPFGIRETDTITEVGVTAAPSSSSI